jgi:UDP-N-acetylglucosamine/UDP-N-acetylgalactosamine diphosphorylase
MGRSELRNSIRDDLLARLRPHGQEHLLRFWDELNTEGQQQLAEQIASIDFQQVAKIYRQNAAEDDWAALSRRAEPPVALRAADRNRKGAVQIGAARFTVEGARRAGADALAQGRVGVLIVAGGQGSRLGFDHAKGLYPIGPVSRASLLAIHFQKVLAAGRRYGTRVPVYVMTSPATHEEQVDFVARHGRFGVSENDLCIFCQGTMPAIDAASGKILLAAKDRVFLSPDGHGGTVAALSKSGTLEDMARRGVEHLFYLQVDNPLVPICDAELIGAHLLTESELTSIAVAKQGPRDKLGNFVSIDGRAHVVEYSDFPDDVAERRDARGELVFWAGSIAVHVFARSLFERALSLTAALPFHVAKKKVAHVDDKGRLIEPAEPNALKFERFIFDLLPHAANPLVVEYPESQVFAPLKNAAGAERDTAEYVQQMMIAEHARWLREAGTQAAEGVAVEISPLWALDAAAVMERADRPGAISAPTYLAG